MNERLGVIASHDRLVGLVELTRLFLIRNELLEATLLTLRLFPAGVHRRLSFGILQKLLNTLIAGPRLSELAIRIACAFPILRHLVVSGNAFQENGIALTTFVSRFNRNRCELWLTERFRRLDRGFNIIRINWINRKKLFRESNRFRALPLLRESEHLRTQHH